MTFGSLVPGAEAAPGWLALRGGAFRGGDRARRALAAAELPCLGVVWAGGARVSGATGGSEGRCRIRGLCGCRFPLARSESAEWFVPVFAGLAFLLL